MGGISTANEIGRRNNPEVSIQRLNKLTYKVKSQSNHDKWYTVINTYKEGWTCDCPDFTFRHLECKHVHAYSERKFTLILLQTFQLQKVSWVKSYVKNVVAPITRNLE